MTKNSIAVLVADDHAIVREGVVSLLNAESDLVVIGEAADGHEAVELAMRVHPDVAVLDVSMPRLNGMTAAAQIRRAQPEVEVVILTVHADRAYVTQALAAGVRGYVLKQAVAAELARAIRAVHQGRSFLSPEIRDVPLPRERRSRPPECEPETAVEDLTLREVEVLQLIAEGYSNKEIAQQLTVSVKTVETHRARLMNKLDIHETAGLVRFAIRKKIVQP
ncbi:MAG TPA: response regulator transcription factor [Candidatus Kryptonia bacterium]|nr:response regulator transcription factor [Candidatus Kryptonia bacterium]